MRCMQTSTIRLLPLSPRNMISEQIKPSVSQQYPTFCHQSSRHWTISTEKLNSKRKWQVIMLHLYRELFLTLPSALLKLQSNNFRILSLDRLCPQQHVHQNYHHSSSNQVSDDWQPAYWRRRRRKFMLFSVHILLVKGQITLWSIKHAFLVGLH